MSNAVLTAQQIENRRELAHRFGPIPDDRNIYTCGDCELRLSSLTPRDILNLNTFGFCDAKTKEHP